jgi:ABC-type transport system involved in multi-copper enzyme maturation permease subunit
MTRVLIARSVRDSWLLLVSCCALTTAFITLRVWFASKIKVDMFIKLFQSSLKFVEDLLPVSIEELASPLGRAAFSFEEGPVIVLMALWTVTRGSECLAGRIGAGTMEMLLAQPLRRITLVVSHTLVTLGGIVAIGAAGWMGLAMGLSISEFDPPPPASRLAPGVVQYIGLGVFYTGAATIASALARTRSQAVAVVIGFYVVELALMIIGRLSPSAAWLEWLTILSAYEPTFLTLGLNRDAATHWPLFWQYNAWLFGLGAAGLALAAAFFCHRDVPAPL